MSIAIRNVNYNEYSVERSGRMGGGGGEKENDGRRKWSGRASKRETFPRITLDILNFSSQT